MNFLGPGKNISGRPGSWAQNYFFSGHQYLAKSSRNYFPGYFSQSKLFPWILFPSRNLFPGYFSQEEIISWESQSQNPGNSISKSWGFWAPGTQKISWITKPDFKVAKSLFKNFFLTYTKNLNLSVSSSVSAFSKLSKSRNAG